MLPLQGNDLAAPRRIDGVGYAQTHRAATLLRNAMERPTHPTWLEPLPIGLESVILKSEADGELRLAWDNRNARKDKGLFILLAGFLTIWTPVTLFVTTLIFTSTEPIPCSIAAAISWLGILGMAYTLLQRQWTEWVVVSPNAVSHGFAGLLAPRPRSFPLSKIREVAVEYPNRPASSEEHEAIVTLNIYHTLWFGPRHMFGYWLAPDVKQKVLETITDFVKAQNIPLRVRQYGSPRQKLLLDWRFSLRSLLIIFIAAALAMGMIAWAIRLVR